MPSFSIFLCNKASCSVYLIRIDGLALSGGGGGFLE